MRVNPVVVCALLCSVLCVSPAEGYNAQQQFLSLYCAGTIYLVSEFRTRTNTSSSLQKIEGNQVNRRVCKCRSAQCRCSSLQPGRRCCCSSRSSAYLSGWRWPSSSSRAFAAGGGRGHHQGFPLPALIGHGRSCRVGSLQTRPVRARQQFSALQNLPSAGLQGPTGVNLNFNS